MSRTAVITGGAGGLGRSLARRLRTEGWFTALVDLPGDTLNAAAREAGQDSAAGYGCDLTDPVQTADVCARIVAERPSVDMVIYNAGITQIGRFADMSLETHRKVIEVNYFGAVHVADGLLGAVRSSKGTHLAISSVAGFTPLFRRTAYAASKHALEGFFKTLRVEEMPFGVQVSIAAPSFVATNLGNTGKQAGGIARPGSAADGLDYMDAGEAASIILDGVKRGKAMIPVGRIAKAAWWINRLSPALYVRLMERNMKADQVQDS